MSPRPLVRLLSVALALLAIARSAAADDGWTPLKKVGGAEYERRSVSGSRFYEYRGRAVVPMSVPAITNLIWAALADHTPSSVLKRVFLSRSDNDVVVYDQIHVPVIRDRDVAIHIHKTVTPALATIEFATANELAPPSSDGRVRLPVVRGSWRIVPVTGGTLLEYTCYSEPGGSVPAFLARGTQDKEVVIDVERILSLLPH